MPKSPSIAVITVLHAVASGHVYGFEIIDATELAGGTVYPALTRLERDGLVLSDWEDVAIARAEKRPSRRYYQVTPRGLRSLNASLERLHALRPIRDARRGRPARARG